MTVLLSSCAAIDVHEAIRGPPPPPVNLAKKPHSEKFNHLYANFGESALLIVLLRILHVPLTFFSVSYAYKDGVTDPEDRIALVVKSMQDIREEWMKVKGRIQVRERKERKKKRKAREKGIYIVNLIIIYFYPSAYLIILLHFSATAERQARLEAAKTLASQSQPQVGGVGGGATVAVGATTGGGSTS